MSDKLTLRPEVFVILDNFRKQFAFPMYIVTSIPKRYTDKPYVVCIAFDIHEADIFAYQGNYKCWKIKHESDFNQIKNFYDLWE